LLRRADVLAAGALGGTVLVIVLAVVLLSGGGDDSSPPAASQPAGAAGSPGATASGQPFAPADEDGRAIEALARRSIEVLPRGEWPSLYDSFTAEYQQRCPRDAFVQAGAAGAAALGSDLPLLRFKLLRDVQIDQAAASAVIVGELLGQGEYTVQGSFQKVNGLWRIAPAPGTDGCNACNRRGN